MEILQNFIDIFLHIDDQLSLVIQNYGTLTYLILFLIIFCETGLVVTPFLPGDSLLFAIGAFAAKGSFDLVLVVSLLYVAAIGGDSLNYFIGNKLGSKVFKEDSKYFKKEYLLQTEKFYEKYGAKTIIIARFMPIVRTFAPFVAGIAKMNYVQFITYNVVGAVLWVSLFIFGGFFFGNIPFVKENFEFVILGIVFASCLPAIYKVFAKRG